jgi:biopolymer transport protein TolR
MAPPIGPGGGRQHKHRRRRARPMSDINVTPFVDVMLVLLIVFMVTAPLLSAGVPVDLPQANAKPLALEKEPVTVTIDNLGKIFVKDDEVEMDGLVPKLTTAVGNDLDQRIYVRGDKTASYGTIMQVMGTINGAGFTHIGLVALKAPDS